MKNKLSTRGQHHNLDTREIRYCCMETNIDAWLSLYGLGIPTLCVLEYNNGVFLVVFGTDIWMVVVNGYKVLDTPPIDVTDNKKMYDCNARAKTGILCGLVDFKFTKFMHYTSTMEIWDKMKNIYDGYEKVKKAKYFFSTV